MGFFSKILGGVVKIARGVLGLPAAAAPVVAAVAPRALAGAAGFATRAGRISVIGGKKFIQAASGQFFPIAAGAAAGALAGGVIGTPASVIAERAGMPFPAAIAMGGALGRGNGQFVRQTIVQTIDLASGEVVRSETFPGAPFAMTKDINRIRSLSKKLKKAASRIGGGTRKEGKAKQLTDAITDRALQNVIAGTAAGKC